MPWWHFRRPNARTPIAVIVRNTDARPSDYDQLRTEYRPGHADRSTVLKHGFRDHRGGGRASGRETVGRVIGGYFAQRLLPAACRVTAWVESLGRFRSLPDAERGRYGMRGVEGDQIEAYLAELKAERRVGRRFDRLHHRPATHWARGAGVSQAQSDLARAVMSVSLVTAFEYGLGHGFGAEHGSAVTQTESNLAGSRAGSRPASGSALVASCVRHRPSARRQRLGVTIRALRLVSYRSSRRWRFWCSPTTSCASAIDRFQPRPLSP